MADILDFCAGGADLGLFEARSCSWVPAEDSEGSGTDFANLALTVFRHANVGIGAKTCFTEDGRFSFFCAGDGGSEFAVC